jgi:hypothetical protein
MSHRKVANIWRGLKRGKPALLLAALMAFSLMGCAPAAKKDDNLVWYKEGGSPQAEDEDFSSCIERASRVADRIYYWRKEMLTKRIEGHSRWAADNRYQHMRQLQDLEKEEAGKSAEITDQCMLTRGYRKVPIRALPRN